MLSQAPLRISVLAESALAAVAIQEIYMRGNLGIN